VVIPFAGFCPTGVQNPQKIQSGFVTTGNLMLFNQSSYYGTQVVIWTGNPVAFLSIFNWKCTNAFDFCPNAKMFRCAGPLVSISFQSISFFAISISYNLVSSGMFLSQPPSDTKCNPLGALTFGSVQTSGFGYFEFGQANNNTEVSFSIGGNEFGRMMSYIPLSHSCVQC
jgi:hypothetical protein